MIIAQGIDAKLGICDIETLPELFDVGFYDPDTGEWTEFEVSQWKNQLYEFVSWYTSRTYEYLVTFNGIHFDQQVLQYVLENYEDWYDLSGMEIADKVSEFASLVIDNGKYNLPSKYKESQFPIKPLDLFKIHHFDNEARRTSLKWCAYMMDMDVEEMPIHHTKRNMTREEADTVIAYRRNDCMVTLGLLYITLGQVDKILEFSPGASIDALKKQYDGKNKIQDRFDVMKETGLNCLNYSDVKIGEEWNKLDYMRAEEIKNEWDLIPKKIAHPYGQKFKNFFPKTMYFRTDQLKEFIRTFGEEKVKPYKQEFNVTVGKTTYVIAKGGIHSTDKNRQIVVQPGWVLMDADVGSQYPNSILKLKIYAPHLKVSILEQFKGKIDKRFVYKDEAKKLKKAGKEDEARPYSSVQEMLKLCLNGGYYGKLGQPGSFLEFPEGLLKVCIGNQIEILMLVEMLELNGIQVVSGNTDGVVCHFPENKLAEYYTICQIWEEMVGNTDMGKLEFNEFAALWQESINHYLGKQIDGKPKKKGNFLTEFELNKNKSKRVIALALEAYFMEGLNPITFIHNHTNIFDFCIAKKATGQMHYEEILSTEGGIEHIKKHKKLIRYYVSHEGNVFMKRGVDYKGKQVNSYCEAPSKVFPWLGEPKLSYFNKSEKIDTNNINYNWYILQTLRRIDKIQGTKKADKYADSLKIPQLSMF